jgi:hypothetical protein
VLQRRFVRQDGFTVFMSVGELQSTAVAIPRSRKTRVETRALVRVIVVALVWGVFVSWCLIVMRGQALFEAGKAAAWLLRVISVYLGLLALWVIYNKLLIVFRGPTKVLAGEARTFDRDYFGRPVAVAAGARFQDQHLVLEYKDNQKVYRIPDAEEAAQEAVVESDVKTLAAAVGARASAAPPSSSDEVETERHVRNL